jgi:hypothetical protein
VWDGVRESGESVGRENKDKILENLSDPLYAREKYAFNPVSPKEN